VKEKKNPPEKGEGTKENNALGKKKDRRENGVSTGTTACGKAIHGKGKASVW